MTDLQTMAGLFRQRDGFLILTHLRPDGDAVGSACALCRGLRALGKTAYLYENPEITRRYMDFAAPYFAPEGFVPGCVAAVDLAGEELFPQGWQGAVELCVDHHLSNTGYAAHTLVWADRASCGEVILALLETLGAEIDRDTADALYVAVSTDTGCFVYGNVTAETHRAAAKIIDLGADFRALNVRMFRTTSRARMLLEGMICAGLEFHRDGLVSVATVTLDMMARSGATENDCDDLAAIAGKAEGSIMSITVRELAPCRCKVSVRTGPRIDANRLCGMFGGGGHTKAAGCTLDCGVEETKARLLAALEEIWE